MSVHRAFIILTTSDQGRTFFAVSAHFVRGFFGHSPKKHRRNPEETAKKLPTWHGGRSGLSGISSPLQPLVFRTSFLRDAFVIRSRGHVFKSHGKSTAARHGLLCDLIRFVRFEDILSRKVLCAYQCKRSAMAKTQRPYISPMSVISPFFQNHSPWFLFFFLLLQCISSQSDAQNPKYFILNSYSTEKHHNRHNDIMKY